MKKLFKIAGVLALLATATAANAQNENQLIGQAKAAANNCMANAPTGWQVYGYVETTGICFVEGNTYRVHLAASDKCTGNQICPLSLAIYPIADVDFDCEGNVTNVTCF